MTRGCDEIRERLHDWVDDALGQGERNRIGSHLEGCASCREELTALENLKARVALLPEEIRPVSDLWPAIEPRLEQPWWRGLLPRGLFARELRLSPPILAAAALLVLSFGLWLWRTPPTPATRASEPVTATTTSFEAQADLARSEDGMLRARRDLIEAVQRQRDHLSPETVAILEENMRIIDQAIGQIRLALEEDPLNQQLRLRLAAHYQQEAELLKLVSGV